MGGLSHSDESMRRGNASRRVFYDKRNARVASGVETDKHKPGSPVSDRRQRDCTAAYNDNCFYPFKVETLWLYAAFCICMPHVAKRLYSEVMLNIN